MPGPSDRDATGISTGCHTHGGIPRLSFKSIRRRFKEYSLLFLLFVWDEQEKWAWRIVCAFLQDNPRFFFMEDPLSVQLTDLQWIYFKPPLAWLVPSPFIHKGVGTGAGEEEGEWAG